jgi:hypothetical protein
VPGGGFPGLTADVCAASRRVCEGRCEGSASGAADAGIGADPQHHVGWVAGQVDDLVSCQAGHGRPGDRSGEPVPCVDELVLGPLVRLEGEGQAVRCHARSMPSVGRSYPVLPGPAGGECEDLIQ